MSFLSGIYWLGIIALAFGLALIVAAIISGKH